MKSADRRTEFGSFEIVAVEIENVGPHVDNVMSGLTFDIAAALVRNSCCCSRPAGTVAVGNYCFLYAASERSRQTHFDSNFEQNPSA